MRANAKYADSVPKCAAVARRPDPAAGRAKAGQVPPETVVLKNGVADYYALLQVCIMTS
jgi:hypothetical protein